jgi:hypothetical protein
MTTGDQVTCNGFAGTVTKMCDGQLTGMAEVRLGSGTICVDVSELNPPIYRNRNFTKRNYELTNVVACSPVDAGAVIPPNYDQADASLIANLTPLWIEGGVRYYGWL